MSRTPEVRGIDDTLSLCDNGQLLPQVHQDNAELLAKIVEYSQAYGTKASGELTIRIKYTTDRYGQIDIVAEHQIKEPKAPKSKGTAWIGDGGGLTVANPNQRKMEIRDIDGRRELRAPGND